MNKKQILLLAITLWVSISTWATDQFVTSQSDHLSFPLVQKSIPASIITDDNDKGVIRAIKNLHEDFRLVTGNLPQDGLPNAILIGTIGQSALIDRLIQEGKILKTELEGMNEKYLIQTVDHPVKGVEKGLIIAGSDKRGTIYGIYEISRQMGVSPWYWWADVPVMHQDNLYIPQGKYTDGEPAVKYRGIFINDEAPCLTGWVKNTYGTNYGDHRFYARVFELLLRLKGNFMWPAMWNWSFYGDDAENSKTAAEMGIIMGTSHHEPMARNHQEWAKNREKYGVWDYTVNQKVIDKFFREGIERVANNEDLITIGMRGDGDTPMGGKEGEDDKYVPRDEENLALLKKIIKNQRQIIKEVTGKSPKKRQQVWAIYKEVQRYYDMGLRVPDDVIMLLSDDNWGNVRRLPNKLERKHPGGWGMYYHVDYVGAPRNMKWINSTPIQNIWEQMQLTYDYGVDKLWVLNVGDIKPMEYPITLFLDMAWNPKQFTVSNLLDHTRNFCKQQFGCDQADEAMRILNLYSKYNGRVTAEMLNCNTYNLETGEWKQVSDEYCKLEAEALRQYFDLDIAYRDAYRQLILFPVQAMSNLYEMYYAQAMNHKLYKENNPEANKWADKVEYAFKRDAELCREYNEVISNGKWNGMMTQKHIGYTNWNDNFPADQLPETYRIEESKSTLGGYIFTASEGVVSMEAEHFFDLKNADEATWTVIPYMGRTLSGIALMPYTKPVTNASLSYRMRLPQNIDSVTVHIVVKSTLAFHNLKGHEYRVSFIGGDKQTINFNADLNEKPENIYSIFYPTVARRVVKKQVKFKLPASPNGIHSLILEPLDPGIVFEKIIVDCGGYKESYLFMHESPVKR